jgi:O-antigen ligase
LKELHAPPIMTFRQASPQFWMLSAFLVLVFLTGGASRVDVRTLLLLRPASATVCALALLTLRREHLADFKPVLAGFGAVLLLVLVYLVPLPPGIWHGLPGRDILADVDRTANLGGVWRPLTMTPMDGAYSALSLLTPLAVLVLGIQLGRDDLFRLLPVMLALGALSGLCGILQVIGSPTGPLYFYAITNNGSAVGLFSNRNHAAVLLACMIPMLATFAATGGGNENEQRLRQIVAAGALIVTVPLILVTGSRAGLFVGLIGLLSAVFLYTKPQTGRAPRRGGLRWRMGPAPLLIVLGVMSLGLLTIFFARAEAFNRVFAQSAGEDSRGQYWVISMQMIAHYFPWGSGIGSFPTAYQIFEPVAELSPLYVNHAHNDWIEIALTMGLPGVIVLMAGLAMIGWRSWCIWRRGEAAQRTVKYGKMASVIIAMLAVASITDYPLRTPSLMSFFTLCLLWLFSPAKRSWVQDQRGGATAEGAA